MSTLPRSCLVLMLISSVSAHARPESDTLPHSKPLTMKGDIAGQMVEGIDRFLLKQIDLAATNRQKRWKRDLSSPAAYEKSMQPYRTQFAHILGVRDKRHPAAAPELVATVDQSALVGKGKTYDIFAIRWKAFGEVHGEGLLLSPRGKKPVASIVAIPDADVTPEQLCGLSDRDDLARQYARQLAECGCRVLVPTLISREYRARNNRAKMTNREYIYRSAFELGRHLIGYELQKVFAAVDWFAQEKDAKIGVIGWGEGGMLALYAAALDTRIQATAVSGYFGASHKRWQQPLDRNVFGLLNLFGDGEVAAMIAPRFLGMTDHSGPEVTLPSEGGAPAQLGKISEKSFGAEWDRGVPPLKDFPFPNTIAHGGGLFDFYRLLLKPLKISDAGGNGPAPQHLRKSFDPAPRQQRQLDELDRHNQSLLEDAHNVRRNFLPIVDPITRPDDKTRLNTSSLAAYEKSIERYREYFATEVIGRFDLKPLPFNARTRKIEENNKWIMYQVVLDVYEDVFAYGLLILPKGMKSDEKRPVVICQHGLEGRPEDCINDKQGYASYKAFATRLAERGFITFAPQNLYIGRDKFRTLQRKANLIQKTLFSVIVPQHQQITDWLKTLPHVDGQRIAFYGLSYGGKTAMRVPPLVKNYCLSICSADFNDWVWKNASTKSPYSYVWTMEYEIFEWDLGSTFNYAEMAALIAPRPFMVERGHFDGVAPDERVALEYARVRHLYQAKLGIGDRTTIEWFVGPHTINGKGTFAFLHKHLNWPEPGVKK